MTNTIDVNELNSVSFLSDTKTKLNVKIDAKKIIVLMALNGLYPKKCIGATKNTSKVRVNVNHKDFPFTFLNF